MSKKLIQSGNILELYEYDKPYLTGYTIKSKGGRGRIADSKSEDYIDNRKKVLNRAKRDLMRLINSNVNQYGDITPKFLTLTFGDNIQDLDLANYEFKKFILRLNYKIYKNKKSNLKYVVGVEFQERGAIHYHIVFFNMPYIKHSDILGLWGNGGAWVNKIANVDNVGAYVTAYLGDETKEQGKVISDSRLQGRKSYFSSRGLYKPIVTIDKKMVEVVIATLPNEKKVFAAKFNNEYLGDILYEQYNLNVTQKKEVIKNI